MPAFLTDSGPLVALLDRSDADHDWAREQFNLITSTAWTCEGAIVEAAHLLENAGLPRWSVLELLDRGIVAIQFDLATAVSRVMTLMKKYEDTPMDFVDACMVVMTETMQDCRLITVDSDFRIYRRFERQAIPLIIPAR